MGAKRPRGVENYSELEITSPQIYRCGQGRLDRCITTETAGKGRIYILPQPQLIIYSQVYVQRYLYPYSHSWLYFPPCAELGGWSWGFHSHNWVDVPPPPALNRKMYYNRQGWIDKCSIYRQPPFWLGTVDRYTTNPARMKYLIG